MPPIVQTRPHRAHCRNVRHQQMTRSTRTNATNCSKCWPRHQFDSRMPNHDQMMYSFLSLLLKYSALNCLSIEQPFDCERLQLSVSPYKNKNITQLVNSPSKCIFISSSSVYIIFSIFLKIIRNIECRFDESEAATMILCKWVWEG